MIVTLQTQGLHTLEQVRAFLVGNTPISFTLTLNDRSATRARMTDTLRRFCYKQASRDERGVLRHFLAKVTGLSRAQVTRCITQFLAEGRIVDRRRAVCAALYGKRHSIARRNGCAAWNALRLHHEDGIGDAFIRQSLPTLQAAPPVLLSPCAPTFVQFAPGTAPCHSVKPRRWLKCHEQAPSPPPHKGRGA